MKKQLPQPGKDRFSFFREHKAIGIIMLLLFLERLFVLYRLGVGYSLESDDLSYIESGIIFANTGTITMHNGEVSAQIMPGMPVFIGLLSLLFGEGKALWLVLKLVWITMGVITPFFVYKSVCLFAPKWCGILSSLFFFAPNLAWMDNLILTETPFLTLLTAMVYYTLMMGRYHQKKHFWCCLAAYMLALMLKANVGIYPLFAFVYLLLVKYDFKLLLKQGLILACAVLCFMIPWSIRNYIQFQTFVPLTYGAGNPTLLGTYQGEGYPSDEELDYETNVDRVMKEKYAAYYDENGAPKEAKYQKFLALQADAIKAKYRQKQWFEKDPKSFLKSYLYLKPKEMVNSVFYWRQVLNTTRQPIEELRQFDWRLCVISFALAFVLKKKRAVMLFLALVYWGNVYLYAMTYAFSRYSETLLSLRYIAVGIGICLMVEALQKGMGSVQRYNESQLQANTKER